VQNSYKALNAELKRMTPPDIRQRYRPIELAHLALLYFPVTFFWTATLSQLLPARVESLAGDSKGFALALIGSGGALAATLCMFIVGPLSDNTSHPCGRRYPWVVGGILLGAIGALSFAFAPSIFWLLLAFVAARLGLAAVIAGYEAILPDRLLRDQHAKAAGFGECFDLIGQVTGLAITALLVKGTLNHLLNRNFPPKTESALAEIIICSIAFVLLIGILLFNLRWIREPQRTNLRPWREVWPNIFKFSPRSAPDIYWLYISRCFLNIGTFTAIEFVRYFLQENFSMKGTDIAHEVMVVGLFLTAGGVLGALIAGAIGDGYSKRLLLIGFGLLCACSALGFSFASSLESARISSFIFGIGFSAINTVDWAWATNLVPIGREARYLGAFQTCFTLPQIYVLGAGGVIGQIFGYRVLFCTIPVYLLIGIFLLFKVREVNVRSLDTKEPTFAG
jgi:MFS family permease